MSEKCKVGFWKWLLIKSPIAVLKGMRDEIVDDLYGFVMVAGVITAILGYVVVQVLFGPFLAFKVIIGGLLVLAYGYYKGFVCEKGDE